MKATLSFDLPEESAMHLDHINGPAWKSVAWEFDQWLRDKIKHGDNQETTYQAIRDSFRAEMESSGVSFE